VLIEDSTIEIVCAFLAKTETKKEVNGRQKKSGRKIEKKRKK